MFSRKSADKFAEIAFRRLSNGLPIIEGGVGFVACKVAAVLPGGDHQIIVGDVECAEATEREPLVHYRGMYHRLFPIT
jgi:flavin reductase (DIM6/NTAB) family NADH-FMN oxidoreductase RutF